MMLFTLWIYLPGFLVNTFAMMWGKWLAKNRLWTLAYRWRKATQRRQSITRRWKDLEWFDWWFHLPVDYLCYLMTMVPENWIFISPTEAATGWAAGAFVMGTFLGFTSLVGDSTGSYFKRRKGMKREGNVSSKAPLLDTLPFAISVFCLRTNIPDWICTWRQRFDFTNGIVSCNHTNFTQLIQPNRIQNWMERCALLMNKVGV